MLKKLFGKSSKSKNTIDCEQDSHVEKYLKSRKIQSEYSFCYAPANSLYFRHNGNTTACCYNFNYILGNYPDQSLHEIWNGSKRKNLVESLQNNNLTKGCYHCNMHLQSGNYASIKSHQYDSFKIKKTKPSLLEFELENTCNLACIMCNGELSSTIRKNEKKQKIESPYDSDFLEQLPEFIPELEEARFYGGEPFLIQIYYSIWEQIVSINPKCRIVIQTNGTILNDRLKKLLSQGNFHITVSLDAASKNTFENIRKNSIYEEILNNITFFKEYCETKKTYFGFSFCPIRENWKEIPDFLQFANKKNIPVYFHYVWIPADHALWTLDTEALQNILETLQRAVIQNSTSVEKNNYNEFHRFLDQVKSFIFLSQKTKEELHKISSLSTNDVFHKIVDAIKTRSIKYDGNHEDYDIPVFTERFKKLISQIKQEHTDKVLRKLYCLPVSQLFEILNYYSDEFIVEQFEKLAKS